MSKTQEMIDLDSSDFERKQPLIPVILNLPTGLIKSNPFYPISTDTCRKWFAYDYPKTQLSDLGMAMLERITNDPLSEYCSEAGKATPYFKRAGSQGIVQELAEGIAELNKQKYTYGMPTNTLENIPDGAVFIKEVERDHINLKLMINDMRLIEYHLNNGITKHGYKLSELLRKKFEEKFGSLRQTLKNQNATFPVVYS